MNCVNETYTYLSIYLSINPLICSPTIQALTIYCATAAPNFTDRMMFIYHTCMQHGTPVPLAEDITQGQRLGEQRITIGIKLPLFQTKWKKTCAENALRLPNGFQRE